jgi:hypothetical protein
MSRQWTDTEVKTLVTMWEDMCTDDEIARRLRRGSRAVALKRYKLGIRAYERPTVKRKAKRPTFARQA